MIGAQNAFGVDLERLDVGALDIGSNVYNDGGHDVKQERAGFPSSLDSQGVVRVGRPRWRASGGGEWRRWKLTLGLVVLVTLASAIALMVLGSERKEVGTVLERKTLPSLVI